jgi:uncharacterized membrane protein
VAIRPEAFGMIGLPHLYGFAALVFAGFAWRNLRDRRFANAGFWGLVAVSMAFGGQLSDFQNGLLALALVGIAGLGRMRASNAAADTAARAASATRWGNRLFVPALIIPAAALLGTWGFKAFPGLVDPKQVTLVSLAMGVIGALIMAYVWLRPRPLAALDEGRRLIDTVGWAAILPQMLASLGAVFALAGVGDAVGTIAGGAIPEGSRLGAVIAFGLGMALFTMIMGNAFAAFPVMAAAIAVPLLITRYGGDPAVVCAIGMLCGFCGTLMTPMAANFNMVPAALLELKDRNGVIKAQIGTALPLLAINIALIALLAFR